MSMGRGAQAHGASCRASSGEQGYLVRETAPRVQLWLSTLQW